MSNITQKMVINPRLFAVLLLGFSSGLPFTLTSSTLQAWFTQSHINLVTIGSLSLLGLPYTLKFFWAPLLDQYSLFGLGKRKGWILLSQFSLVVMLLVLAHMDPSLHVSQMRAVAFMIVFLSATQDIAIDAYRTDILNTSLRGLGVAYTVFGYRVATLISGGFALICADYIGWKMTYEIMAVLILLCMIPTYIAPPPVELSQGTNNILTTMVKSLKDILQRDKIILLLFFIVFYKIGDALALQLMTNFLLHGLGFSLTEVGLAYKIVSFIATITGAFVGGAILTRWNIYRGLLFFGLAQAFSNLMFVALAIAGKQFILMTAAIFIENFCSGLSTAALLAFLMSLCNSRYTASQIALLSAIASLGRVLLGPIAGLMVENVGWTQFYIWSFLLCFPGLLFLLFLKTEISSYAEATRVY